MATLEQLQNALVKADAAGNVEDARAFANEIRSMRTAAPVAQPTEKRQSLMSSIGDTLGNIGAGAIRGAGSIGATILTPIDAAARAMGIENDYIGRTDRREAMDYALQDLGADPKSMAYQGGKLGAEIAGTLPVGGVLAKGLTKAAPGATRLAEALRTGGMSTGAPGVQILTRAGGKDLALRAAGGGITGGASTLAINPEDTGMGAGISAALPVGGKLLVGAGRGVGKAFTRQQSKVAEDLAQAIGMSTDELTQALSQQGPQILSGYQKTVPQILQNPVTSQLQRSLQTAGQQDLANVGRNQQEMMTAGLERIAPIQATNFDAAQRAGQAIEGYAVPARQQATQNVQRAFESVDPFNETALNLPISEMERSAGKYLGTGTFGTGSRASEAINTAKRVGTEELPAVKAISQSAAGKAQNLEQAVRAAGGVRGTTGELKDLGVKQSKTTGLVNNKSGKSADLLAEDMYQRGFIPDNDPATLIDMLRNGGGRKVFASDAPESGYQRAMESAMGEAPEAKTIAKAVPFQTVQNLRSSIGEAAATAEAKGANKEAAALKSMIADIDNRINRAAGGSIGEGEFFPKDIADQYREALKLHANKMEQFGTGPQAGMFRKGGDNQISVQGAEVAPKFYNAAMSQADDIKAFKKLIGNRTDLADELKSFAVTQADKTRNAQGDLGQQYIKWMEGKSGANRELMSPKDMAIINEVGRSVENQIKTEGLGRVTGSDTAQKLKSLESNGLLDNKAVDFLMNRTPILKNFSGPMLQNLRNTATETKNKELARLLANPDEFVKALSQQTNDGQLIKLLRSTAPIVQRSVPALSAQ